jgi:drug/metabolite transporter (DMT)-like permease
MSFLKIESRLVFVTLFSIAWAIQSALSKAASNYGAYWSTFTYQTLFVATLSSFFYILFTKKKFLKYSTLPNIIILSMIGFIGTGGVFASMYYGLELSTVGNFGFLIKTTTFFTVILGAISIKEEKLTIGKMTLLSLLMIGAFLISTKGNSFSPKVGDLFIILAAFLLSGASVVIKKFVTGNCPSEVITVFRTFFGGVVLVLYSLVFDKENVFTIQTPITLLLGTGFFCSYYSFSFTKH